MPARITLDSVVTAVPSQVSADLGGEVVVLGLERGAYYGLDGIGSRIWQLLGETRTVTELCDAISDEYEVDRETCQQDLIAFLDGLATAQLIVVGETQPG